MNHTESIAERNSLFSGARFTIIGCAREGIALAKYVAARGAEVSISDIKTADQLQDAVAELSPYDIRWVLGAHPEEILACDALFVSPGVPMETPVVQEAVRRGITVSGESRFFLEHCPAAVTGITGSSGKTTTVTLTGEILRTAGFRTWVGGNIGRPLTPHLDEIHAEDKVVMELSSFQLEIMSISPAIAAILNITPNHLDRHASMEDYVQAKVNILRYQRPDNVAVLGYDNEITRGLAKSAKGQVAFFSMAEEVAEGAFLKQEQIILRLAGSEQHIGAVQDIRLRGRHNVANVLAACTLAGLAGADHQSIAAVIFSFAGVEHRLEFVREVAGVRYYDDSIATTPERTIAALGAFNEPIVLLAGGQDKHLPWAELALLMLEKTRGIVLFGQAAGIIESALTEASNQRRLSAAEMPVIKRVVTLEEAVQEASRLAHTGDIVLLSPGGTSYDAFKDFTARGERFKELVKAL